MKIDEFLDFEFAFLNCKIQFEIFGGDGGGLRFELVGLEILVWGYYGKDRVLDFVVCYV